MKTNLKLHLKSLVQLSMCDEDFGESEKAHIYAIGKANKLSEADINEIFEEVLKRKEEENIEFIGLTPDEQFDYLYDIIQLMKIDGKVFLSEIKYCQEIAEKLGYDKKVVKNLSAQIYSSPNITSNREMLIQEANKYLK